MTYLHHDQAGHHAPADGLARAPSQANAPTAPTARPTCEGTATTPLGYDGQYTSTDTGLVYMRAASTTRHSAVPQVDPLEMSRGRPTTIAGDNPLNVMTLRGFAMQSVQ